jgi:cyclophilin family peptidyl-prolyl cis-trans isomerase
MKIIPFIIVILGITIGALALLLKTPTQNNNIVTMPTKGSATPMPQTTNTPPVTKQYKQAETVIQTGKNYTAVLHTEKGDIEISLNTKDTPLTSNNFIFLAKDNFYDGVIFHRTIPGFMIQGGDPTGTGSGGPGYQFADEKFSGEYTRGTVAMANAGKNTNGSQFFIMHQDYALPKNYVIFGKVTKGLEVVDAIATAPTKTGGEGSTPVNPVHITSITITEN